MAWFEVQTMLENSTSLCSVQNNDTGTCTAKTQERQIVLIVQYNPAGAAFSFSCIQSNLRTKDTLGTGLLSEVVPISEVHCILLLFSSLTCLNCFG